jgi:hypothetical protein
VKLRCGVRDGRGKLCNREVEMIADRLIFAAGYIESEDSPGRLARCPKHGQLYVPEHELNDAIGAKQAVLHVWRFRRSGTRPRKRSV